MTWVVKDRIGSLFTGWFDGFDVRTCCVHATVPPGSLPHTYRCTQASAILRISTISVLSLGVLLGLVGWLIYSFMEQRLVEKSHEKLKSR